MSEVLKWKGDRECRLCSGNIVRPESDQFEHFTCGEKLRDNLVTLAANLAVAGGLCEAFDLGYDGGWHDSGDINEGAPAAWRPNTKGRAAPW